MEMPVLKDELERKTIETLQWILQMTQSAQMSEAELKVATQTVFSITAGLVDSKVSGMCSMVGAEGKAKTVVRRVFTSETSPKLFIASWEVGSEEFCVTGQSLLDRTIKSSVYKLSSSADAKAKYEALCQQLRGPFNLTEIT